MKTTQECWQALIDGETLISDETGLKIIMIDEEPCWEDNGLSARTGLSNVRAWSIYTPPKWYDNIPEGGVLCWCFDVKDGYKALAAVTKYLTGSDYPFRPTTNEYRYAIPLTKQEIQQLLDNAPEGE